MSNRPTFLLCRPADIYMIHRCGDRLTDTRWIYVGKDAGQYFELGKKLASLFPEIPIGERLNRTAQAIRGEFVNLDQVLDEVSIRSLPWQASATAENNPYMSDFFHQCCATIVLQSISEDDPSDLIIVCEDIDYIHFLAGYLKKQGYDIILPVSFNRIKRYRFMKNSLGWLSARVIFLWRNLWRMLQLYIIRHRSDKPCKIQNKLDSLFVIWGTKNTFVKQKQLECDSYYGELAWSFYKAEQTLAFLVMPVIWIDAYRDIVRNALTAQDDVVFAEDCLTAMDYLRVIGCAERRRDIAVQKQAVIAGINVSKLLQIHLKKEDGRLAYLESLKYYFVGQRLGKITGDLTRMIHLFENQPWEKMLRMGLRSCQESLKVIGCQHAPFPRLYLNYFPSQRSIGLGLLPDHIVSIGRGYKRIFEEHGYRKDQIKAGSAFRYKYLFDIEPNDQPVGGNVLIATSIGFEESLELIYKTLSYFCETTRYQVMLKFHPKLNRKEELITRVLRMLGRKDLPAHIQIVSENMQTLLQRASIVFYNFTAVCYEALVRHIPVIFVKSDIWFDMNKLEWFEGVNFSVRSTADIHSLVESINAWDPGQREKWGQEADKAIAESFSEPLSEELARAYS